MSHKNCRYVFQFKVQRFVPFPECLIKIVMLRFLSHKNCHQPTFSGRFSDTYHTHVRFGEKLRVNINEKRGTWGEVLVVDWHNIFTLFRVSSNCPTREAGNMARRCSLPLCQNPSSEKDDALRGDSGRFSDFLHVSTSAMRARSFPRIKWPIGTARSWNVTD